MLEKEDVKNLLKTRINNCLCIDDSFLEPYSDDNDPNIEKEKPKNLYKAFREQLSCSLDVYRYQTLKNFNANKEFILSNRDLIILDWQLNENCADKSQDTIYVLTELCKKNIKFINIYTTADVDDVGLQIVGAFNGYDNEIDNNIYNKLKESFADYIEEKGSDVETVTKLLKEKSKGANLNTNEIKFLVGSFINELKTIITGDDKELCKKLKATEDLNSPQKLLEWAEMHFAEAYKKPETKDINLKVIQNNTFIANGTLICVTSKDIQPNELFEKLVDCVFNLPMNKSFLLSLLLSDAIDENISSIDSSLGKLDDAVLQNHCNKLLENGDDNLVHFVASTLSEFVSFAIRDAMDLSLLNKLMKIDGEEKTTKPEDEKAMLRTNSFLTFIPRCEMKTTKRKIQTGDVFKLQNRIFQEENDEFIICISQSCDCLRPNKIHNNYSFAIGLSCKARNSLESAEKELFTYLPNEETIKWTEKHLTINIENNEINPQEEEKYLSFPYSDNKIELEYLGQQKEIYTQRIINNAFNHAMRIGVDLPHLDCP